MAAAAEGRQTNLQTARVGIVSAGCHCDSTIGSAVAFADTISATIR